ncbi:MAG: DUF1330 domain-containing protein [Candidatus Acidiferrales bacterium]
MIKTNHKLAVAALAGALLTIGGGRLLRAQEAKTPPAYVIAEVEVTDPVTLKKYTATVSDIVASHGGHYVIRGGGKIQSLEGEPVKGAIVVIGFASAEKARAWYDSPEYAAIRPYRQSSTKSRIYIAEGVAPE